MNAVFTIKITRPDESETESMWKIFQAADLVQDRWSNGSTLKDFARRLRDRELTRDERRFILRAWASLVDGVGGFGRLMSSFEEYKVHYQDPDVDYVKAKPELEQMAADAALLPVFEEAYREVMAIFTQPVVLSGSIARQEALNFRMLAGLISESSYLKLFPGDDLQVLQPVAAEQRAKELEDAALTEPFAWTDEISLDHMKKGCAYGYMYKERYGYESLTIPLYSKECIEVFSAELEAKDKRIDELEQTLNVANDATRIWKERALAAEAKLARADAASTRADCVYDSGLQKELTMTQTLTTQDLRGIFSYELTPNENAVREMARELLANREAQPLFTAPPAPAVPPEADEDSARRAVGFNRYIQAGYIDGWNACRAAMLPASEVTPITDKRQSMAEQMEIGARLTNHRFNVNGTNRAAMKSDTQQPNVEDLKAIPPALVKLPPLTAELANILGRPNFQCCHLAQALRAGGHDIPRKAEAEQAAVIYFMLGHYLEHGEKWSEKAEEELQRLVATGALK